MSRRSLLPGSALLIAIALLSLATARRIDRVAYVSALAQPAATERNRAAAVSTAPIPPRRLITPERHESAAAHLIETQYALAHGIPRVRWTADENAPVGRRVFTASPPRWWLALVAQFDAAITRRTAAASVDHAALVSEPLLHLLLLAGFTVFSAWRFGAGSATAFAVGGVTLFPLAASFLPGVPDGSGLVVCCTLGAVGAAAAGFCDVTRARRWLVGSGVWGGLGLWIDARAAVMALAGILAGGLVAHRTSRRAEVPVPDGEAWQWWSVAGAATALAAYLFEYAPADLGAWELRANHPLYALAWLGAGQLLARFATDHRVTPPRGPARDAVALVAGSAAIALVPLVMKLTGSRGLLDADVMSFRLSSLPGAAVAANAGAWLQHEGIRLTVWATLLPLGILAMSGAVLAGRLVAPRWKPAVAFTLGPVLVGGAAAWFWIGLWALVDAALLIALVVGIAATADRMPRAWRVAWIAVLAGAALPGLIAAWPVRAGPGTELTRAEAERLIERDLAQWLSRRAGESGAIVYAPPQVTSSLRYFGGFRGLGTLAAGNEAGFGLSLAIAGARTIEEVQWALQSRNVRYVVVPSWDPFFDEFARLHLVAEHAGRISFFVHELRRRHMPAWLRPIAYAPPVIPGLEAASALVFEVVEEQPAALASARLAEFLVETGRLEEAGEFDAVLRRFPGDLGALTARAQLQSAREDTAGFDHTLAAIRARLALQADRYLAWDRRVGLAAVLAEGGQLPPARAQLERCLAEMDERKLRALNEGALYRLLVLSDAFELPLPAAQRALAEDLLRPALRAEL